MVDGSVKLDDLDERLNLELSQTNMIPLADW